MHLVLKKVQFLHFLTWNKSPLSVYNIPYFLMFVYFFFFKRLKNVHFLIKIHIFGRNALNCALYLEFNVFQNLTVLSLLIRIVHLSESRHHQSRFRHHHIRQFELIPCPNELQSGYRYHNLRNKHLV